MTARELIGLYGGTFDPVHQGHIQSALELKRKLALDELRLIPCHRPPHRQQPAGSSDHRLAMLKLALRSCPELLVDDCELQRDRPSYSVETLEYFRQQVGSKAALCWIMGSDAFASLEQWHRWQEILHLAHVVVMQRPKQEASLPISSQADALWQQNKAESVNELRQHAAGKVLMLTLKQYPISATAIRTQLADTHNRHQDAIKGLDPAVAGYIVRHQLYDH